MKRPFLCARSSSCSSPSPPAATTRTTTPTRRTRSCSTGRREPRLAGDGATDAPPDGTVTTSASKIWAVGDFLTDGSLVAGRFLSTDTLPFNTATPPGTIVPGGTAVLGSGTGFTQFVFDVSADGTKTAFVADLTTAGTFDLYVADADGANATILVPGVANVEITSILFSPDGTKIAYTADTRRDQQRLRSLRRQHGGHAGARAGQPDARGRRRREHARRVLAVHVVGRQQVPRLLRDR